MNNNFHRLWIFILKNKTKLESLNLILDKEDISNDYISYYEEGELFIIKIEESIFKVGYKKVGDHFSSKYTTILICNDQDNNLIEYDFIYNILSDKKLLRNFQLKQIGI